MHDRPRRRRIDCPGADFGTLSFLDRAGQPAKRGISVGKENGPIGAISKAARSRRPSGNFKDVTEDRFPDGLPVALRISVFRSWKGIIEKGILGSLSVRNPQNAEMGGSHAFSPPRRCDRRANDRPRIANAATAKSSTFSRTWRRTEKLQIELRCLDPAQYFGVAQDDVYLRTPDAPFFLNFFKGYLGIWLQMMLLTALGVFFSTFLSGPVAMLSTAGMLVGGLWHDFLFQLATGQHATAAARSSRSCGSSPRITSFPKWNPACAPPWCNRWIAFSSCVLYSRVDDPAELRQFDFSDFVANGFNIPGEMLVKFLLPRGRIRHSGIRGVLFLLQNARGGQMTARSSFLRKICYIFGIGRAVDLVCTCSAVPRPRAA